MPQHIAAQVAARQRMPGGWAAQVNRGSLPQFPDDPIVQILLNNGSWLDISADVMWENKVQLTRDKAATDTRVRTATCQLTIDNRDGKYSPRNPTSILYGLISRNTQVRTSRRGKIRFWGEVPEWPLKSTTGDKWAYVPISAAGILRRLLAPNAPLFYSSLRRTLSAASGLVAYFPMEDGTQATTFANLVDRSAPMVVRSGTVSFASVTTCLGSQALPSLTSSGVLAATFTPPASTLTATTWHVEASVQIPVMGSTNIACAFGWSMANAQVSRYEILIGNVGGAASEGEVVIRWPYTIGGAKVTRTGIVIDDGNWHHIAVTMSIVAGSLVGTIFVDGVQGSTALTDNAPLGQVTGMDFNARSDIATDTFILAGGHAMTSATNSTVLVPDGYNAFTGHNLEPAGTRVQRLCGEEGINFMGTGDLTDTALMGPQRPAKLIDLFYDCEDADQGFFYELQDAFGLGFRGRRDLYNQPRRVALQYHAPGNIDSPLEPSDNDQRIINDSTANRVNGSSAQVVLASGPMSILPPSQGGIGRYPEGPTFNVGADSQLLDLAGIRVFAGTIDQQRFDFVKFNISNMIVNHGNIGLVESLMSLKVGDLITVDNTPVWIPPNQVRLIDVGQSEWYDQFEHELVTNTILAAPYDVGVLEDPILGRLSDDTTTIRDLLVTTTATTFQIDVTGPLWITVAFLAALDTPETWVNFDWMIAGERITITDISGASTPQTVTCIRSVNGVVKQHIAGEVIYMNNPMILA